MTGGVLPDGADTVLMIEHVEEHMLETGHQVKYLGTDSQAKSSNFSPRGEDVPEGTLVLERGTVLGPKHTALLASGGYAPVSVSTLPRVALFSTGNEVVEPNALPEVHQIRNANAPQTRTQLKELGIEPAYYASYRTTRKP